jgi:hypothetical protein
MPLPMPFSSFRVFVPRGILSREPINQDVGPPIAVEIVRKCEKIIRIGIDRPEAAFKSRKNLLGPIALFMFEGCVGRIKLVSLLEIRPFVPIRPGDNIYFPITIEISEVGPFGPKLIRELDFLKVWRISFA